MPAGALGLVLAGGRSERFGAGLGKAAALLQGRPLLQWAWQSARGQCERAAISVADAAQGREFSALLAEPSAEWISDSPQWRGMGPMAGIASALGSCGDWLLLFPVDTPLLPPHYAEALVQFARQEKLAACYSRHAGREHYACAIWHRSAALTLAAQLQSGERSLRAALKAAGAQPYDFTEQTEAAWFANINTQGDLLRLS